MGGWRAEQAERERQLAERTDEELALYKCLSQGQLDSTNRDLYREGYVEVRPGQRVWPPPSETPAYLLTRDPDEDFRA